MQKHSVQMKEINTQHRIHHREPTPVPQSERSSITPRFVL